MELTVVLGSVERKIIHFASVEKFEKSNWYKQGWRIKAKPSKEVAEQAASVKQEEPSKEVAEQADTIEALRAKYKEVIGKPISARFKNDVNYMQEKIDAETKK